ncbi:unnamed protein product [Moneuplotes crassus]|uniref:Uncharacterized protein n=1 Tax=Euplotes crassus TaxID=5936 RepID=A0AAD1XK06_EUPCR|nr:unnamed protein product [Moneuplotes crassus]
MNSIGYRTKNMLLVTDDVGKAKPSTRKLPSENFTYGKAEDQDVEGAGDVMSNWKFHGRSSKHKPDRDFKKLNKMGLKSKATNARDIYKFRQQHDARVKEPKIGAGRRNNLPPEEFTYGIPCRPSTPIRDVMGNFFGEMAENELKYKYYQTRSNFRKTNMAEEANKHTTKSKIAHEFIKSKGKEDETHAKLFSGSKDLFKINRFKKVAPRYKNPVASK